MPMVYHTVQLYGACARETLAAARRSPWAALFLVVAFVVQFLAGLAVAPLGIAGSFLLGFLQAFLVGWYLALVRHAMHHRRPLTLPELRDRAGALFRETISVLFLFSIGTLLLSSASPMMPLVAVPAAAILFNSVPEAIYSSRATGLELLGEAWEFIKENWPEWLAINAVAVAVFAAVNAALTRGPDLGNALAALQLFGPWFGFLNLPSWAVHRLGLPIGLLVGLGLGMVAHAFMLFRGFLFQQLSSGNRRARAFRARSQR
jgi:hypothetical protein